MRIPAAIKRRTIVIFIIRLCTKAIEYYVNSLANIQEKGVNQTKYTEEGGRGRTMTLEWKNYSRRLRNESSERE